MHSGTEGRVGNSRLKGLLVGSPFSILFCKGVSKAGKSTPDVEFSLSAETASFIHSNAQTWCYSWELVTNAISQLNGYNLHQHKTSCVSYKSTHKQMASNTTWANRWWQLRGDDWHGQGVQGWNLLRKVNSCFSKDIGTQTLFYKHGKDFWMTRLTGESPRVLCQGLTAPYPVRQRCPRCGTSSESWPLCFLLSPCRDRNDCYIRPATYQGHGDIFKHVFFRLQKN